MKKLVFLLSFCLFLINPSIVKAQASSEVILERPLGITLLKNGNLLVADGGGRDYSTNGGKIVEIGQNGNISLVFDQNLNFPHKAIELENGNILIVDTTNNRLLEVSKEKKVIWSTENFLLSDGTNLNNPTDVLEAEDSIFLVADTNNGRVIKINREGKILFQIQGLFSPTSVDYKNGNILVVESEDRRVVEFNKFGKQIWQCSHENLPEGMSPITASYLENGNVIVVDTANNRVLEITPERKIVFEIDEGLSSPFEALERDGEILISDSNHASILQFNLQKDISWSFSNAPEILGSKFSNGDFEIDKNKDNFPDNWLKGNLFSQGRGSFETSDLANSGEKSIKISYDGYGYLFLFQRVKVKPEQDYDLLGMIKSQDFKGISRFEVIFRDRMGGQVGDTIVTPSHSGTTDWTRYETVFATPEGVETIDIRCFVDGVGEIWFDEISFKQVGWQREVGIKLSGAIILLGIITVLVANKLVKKD